MTQGTSTHGTSHVALRMARGALLGGMLLAVPACDGGDSPTGEEPGSAVAVELAVASNTGEAVQGDLVVEGTNGTLILHELSLVVEEIELDGAGGTGDFEEGALFLEAALEGSTVPIVSGRIPPGTYEEFEFELDDLDDDEAVLTEVRAIRPDWPDDASIRVAGTFHPTEGDPRDFVLFLEAELEIEMDLSPPLVVEELDEETLLVTLAPGLWFTRPDGSIVDLSQWDHIDGGELLELEIEIENGFLKVEWDD